MLKKPPSQNFKSNNIIVYVSLLATRRILLNWNVPAPPKTSWYFLNLEKVKAYFIPHDPLLFLVLDFSVCEGISLYILSIYYKVFPNVQSYLVGWIKIFLTKLNIINCHTLKLLPNNDRGGVSAQKRSAQWRLRFSTQSAPTRIWVCVSDLTLFMLFCIPHSYLQNRVMRWKWWHLSRKPVLLTLQPLWFSAAVIHCVTWIVCSSCHLLAVSYHHVCAHDERCRPLFFRFFSTDQTKLKPKGVKLIICTLLVSLLQYD